MISTMDLVEKPNDKMEKSIIHEESIRNKQQYFILELHIFEQNPSDIKPKTIYMHKKIIYLKIMQDFSFLLLL